MADQTIEKLPTREQIDVADKWKVEDIYASDQLWEEDYQKLEKQANEPCVWKGKVGESAQNLYHALKESDDCDWLVERVYVYAFIKYYEDTTNPVYQDLSGRAQNIAVQISAKYAFLIPEILAIPQDVLKQYREDTNVSQYNIYIE